LGIRSADDNNVLLATLDPLFHDVEDQKNIPCQGRLIIYQLMREEIVGVNTGGVEIRFPPNEYDLKSILVYPHGIRGLLRAEAQGDITGLEKQCDTIRTNVLPRCRNAVIRLFRDIYHGTPEEKRATRLLLGMLRIEFNVQSLSHNSARDKLNRFLGTMGACDMLLPGLDNQCADQKRRVATFKLLNKLCVTVRKVRVELVLESFIHAVRELYGMISTLGSADTLDERRKQRIPKKDYPRLLRVFKDLGQRPSNPKLYGYCVDIYGDYPREYMVDLIKKVFFRRTLFTNEANEEKEGLCLVDKNKVGAEQELSHGPVEMDWAASSGNGEQSVDDEEEEQDVQWTGVVQNIEPSSRDGLKALTRGTIFARRRMTENLQNRQYQTIGGYKFFTRYLSLELASAAAGAGHDAFQTPDNMEAKRDVMAARVSFEGKTEYCVDITKLLQMEQPADCGSRLVCMSGDNREVRALSEIVKALGYSRHCMSRFYAAGDKAISREKRATLNLKKRIAGDPYFMTDAEQLTTDEKWWDDNEYVNQLIAKVRK